MESEITNGTILIEEKTLLPKELLIESETYLPGWKIVKHFDAIGLSREIQRTGWTFFCAAREIRTTVFGIDMRKTVRRAVERILARTQSEKLNSLEITRVACTESERFPLVRYVSVAARLRHLEPNCFLYRAKDYPVPEPGKLENPRENAAGALDEESAPETDGAAVRILA
jgi:hypothetical protein